MSYHIFASIYDGVPSLHICDAHNGHTVLQWQYTSQANIPTQEVQQLFRELILLTCQQEINNVRLFQCRQGHQQAAINAA